MAGVMLGKSYNAMNEWLVEEIPGRDAIVRSAASVAAIAERELVGPEAEPLAIAVRLHDILIRNNKKWFNFLGGADVRVDVVVVQGNIVEDDKSSAYTPSTTRFADVGRQDSLATDEHGLLIYYGRPKHFLDISVMISRDTKDSDDLAKLIKDQAGSKEFGGALEAIVGLAVTAPQAAIVAGAVGAASVIGNLAYQVVRAVSGNTIGIYHGNRLAYPDRFGIGRNPPASTYQRGDMSFWYEVVEAEQKP